MSKVKDLSVVQTAIAGMVDEKCPDLIDFIGRDASIFCILAIYQTNNLCSGYGQDFVPDSYRMMICGYKKVSVISFETGVSVIVDSHSSRYQDRFPMCGYESLEDDLNQIAISIQAAIDRINV